MGKVKYDRANIKLKFFQSDFDEVRPFIAQELHQDTTINKQLAQKTKGRAKEKQAYKEKVLEKALEKQAKEEAKSLEIPTEQLLKAKKTVIGLLMKKLQQNIESWNINVSEQEKILKMIKTELGEPTTISKNDTTVRGEPLDENLFIQN